MQTSVVRLSWCSLTAASGATLRRAAAQRTANPLSSSTVCCCSSSPSSALVCGRRTFYDKIREERDGSDDGPEQMFEDFAKSPHRQRVPVELHKGNKDAVEGAERLNLCFFLFLIPFVCGILYFIDPFGGDQYERPEGYGVTAANHISGHGSRA